MTDPLALCDRLATYLRLEQGSYGGDPERPTFPINVPRGDLEDAIAALREQVARAEQEHNRGDYERVRANGMEAALQHAEQERDAAVARTEQERREHTETLMVECHRGNVLEGKVYRAEQAVRDLRGALVVVREFVRATWRETGDTEEADDLDLKAIDATVAATAWVDKEGE